jgi:hypothetical protein
MRLLTLLSNSVAKSKLIFFKLLILVAILTNQSGLQAQSTQEAETVPSRTFDVPPGTHLIKGGNCLIAGGVLMLLGAGAITTGVLVPTGSNVGFYALVGGGGAMIFTSIVLEIAGGVQFKKAGKQLNILHLGERATLQISPAPTGLYASLNF